MPAEDNPPFDPARAALDQPHLTADELEKEIGDSEDWDEASHEDLPEQSDENP